MIFRGPDGEGRYIEGNVIMGMRRLSVIDLEHGWQPLKSRNDEIVAFQNGEIYNYKELRKELEQQNHIFHTNSDTEVLAHGYALWGIEGLLQRIDGMYAIAILDRTRRELHLARDRFGEKPLFYCFNGDRFAYASNLIPLAALPWVNIDISPCSLDRYLALHYVPGDKTIFKNIYRVLPGERLLIPIDKPLPVRYRYYRINLQEDDGMVTDDELAGCLENAVKSRLIADVPAGVFLSGGLDSSIIAAIAARHVPAIDTFSMGFQSREHDESDHARHLARSIGSNHHHFIFNEEDFLTFLPMVASALDEPVGDQAMLPLYWLCREARRYVTVVLSGEGADEVFSGYDYYARFIAKNDKWIGVRQLLTRLAAKSTQYNHLIQNHDPITPSGFPLLTDRAERQRLINYSFVESDDWEMDFISWLSEAKSPLQRASAADMATWLPDDLLIKYDRMAMAHSLEGRAPYLMPQLVEMGLNLPADERMIHGVSKKALRRVASRWVPNEILQRRKQGFVLPMRKWLNSWFVKYGDVESYFISNEFPLINSKELIKMVSLDLNQGVNRERLLFALLLLVEWYNSFSFRVTELRNSLSDYIE
ncbi:MAG: asparagine synthase (glutamine-hydrolyzing) [Nitrospirae bacterium RBG_16_43_11]|nr:MAG: asparagine synthase (glutamine-hydrolyzing) [Nitrospirae bacterium RBG_16_43_11]